MGWKGYCVVDPDAKILEGFTGESRTREIFPARSTFSLHHLSILSLIALTSFAFSRFSSQAVASPSCAFLLGRSVAHSLQKPLQLGFRSSFTVVSAFVQVFGTRLCVGFDPLDGIPFDQKTELRQSYQVLAALCSQRGT